MFSWQQGRQGTGYEKLKLFESQWFKFDCYLIRYSEGQELPVHIDPVNSMYKHHRLNIVLKAAEQGGEFIIEGNSTINTKRIKLFRPDINPHGMSRIIKGKRLLFSFGWLTKY